MAWAEVLAVAPTLSFHQDGKVTWNTGLQILLGDPEWVRLMWNASEKWLGIRAETSVYGLSVSAEPEGSEYMIDSAVVLAAAGISVDATLTATPEQTTQDVTMFGYARGPVFYITLP